MVSLGILLLVLGIGSFILPLLGFQFRILSIFGANQDIAAIVIAVVGAALVAVGISRQRSAAPATSVSGGGTAPMDPQAPPKPVPAPERAPGAGLESAPEPPVMGTTLPPSSSHTGLDEPPAVADPRATPPNPPQG